MQLPKRDREFKWNLNTIIQLVTLAAMLIGRVAVLDEYHARCSGAG
jgi:hypothetical protein